ncbi:HPr family phosphocarrier protein [Effusibacillus consociatus]|uniref:HPr family phosphocarrier protein n=1 Tax=Effusibacillus consociatus TaxID=1117041 RepID=A0ABV9Q2W9_9BACL
MVDRQVKVNLRMGLHAREAVLFVKQATQFKSDIFVEKGGKTVNAKSIMGLMSQVISNGSVITIRANGSDAERAVETLVGMVS